MTIDNGQLTVKESPPGMNNIMKLEIFWAFYGLSNQFILIIPKGCHNCQLSIVNCQFS